MFVVRGLYDGGVVGEDAVVMVTTLEDGMHEMSCTTYIMCVREHFHNMIVIPLLQCGCSTEDMT